MSYIIWNIYSFRILRIQLNYNSLFGINIFYYHMGYTSDESKPFMSFNMIMICPALTWINRNNIDLTGKLRKKLFFSINYFEKPTAGIKYFFTLNNFYPFF